MVVIHKLYRPGSYDQVCDAAFGGLLDECRWLAWGEELRGGNKTKVPYAPRGQARGSATDPATWGTHAEAKARARQLDQLDDGRKNGLKCCAGRRLVSKPPRRSAGPGAVYRRRKRSNKSRPIWSPR